MNKGIIATLGVLAPPAKPALPAAGGKAEPQGEAVTISVQGTTNALLQAKTILIVPGPPHHARSTESSHSSCCMPLGSWCC